MLKEWWTRLRFLMSPKPNREIDDEVQFHIERQAQEYIATGMTPQEARRKAVVEFGGVESVRAQSHEQRPSFFLGTLLQDVSYALRQLRKSRSFTVTAVLTLALGIGGNAAIFTLVNAILLKNLPVVDPSTLIHIGNTTECCVNEGTAEQSGASDDGSYALFATGTWQQLQKNAPEFEELAAMQSGFDTIIARPDKTQEAARSVTGEFVSGNYFRTFGLQPTTGRLFTDADNVIGAPLVAVMSYNAWQNDYASDPSVVGSTFWINTRAVTITGIAPKGFYGDRLSSAPPDFYLPIESMPVVTDATFVHEPGMRWLYIIGRLKPGVAMAPLQAKITELVRQSLAPTTAFSGEQGKRALAKAHVVLSPGGAGIQDMQDSYASKLKLLMWISGLVLLIACGNIANLLLVRGMNRREEMSVRAALGAMRTRIARQLLTESIVLSIISGMAGLIVAYAGTRMLLAMAFPGAQNVPIDASPSGVVLAFAFGISLLTGILFGVAPAWITSNANPADALRSGTRTTSGASLLQRSLIVLQSALALVLLAGAGMFIQSLNKLRNIDLKLDPANRYIVHFNPQAAGYSPAQVEALYRTIENRFHAIPGVQKIGISSNTPMEANNSSDGVQIQGQPYLNDGASWVRGNAEYFDSVGTQVLMGRGFTTRDTSTSPAVAVVNQSFVKAFFKPGENPIGRRFGSPGTQSSGDFEIVGIVEDTAYNSATWKNHHMYFLPMTQRIPESVRRRPIEQDTGLYAGAIVIQTGHPMDNIESIARQTLAAINPNLSVVKFQTFDEQIADRFTQDRMITRLMTLFSILALLLASLGLYGVTAYTVARRTSEIGIRMALGANRSSVVGMIMRGAMLQTAIGLAAIGIPVAWFCVRYIESQLYESKGMSLAVLTIATLTLTAAAAAAGLIPAQRAASTNPSQALRTE